MQLLVVRHADAGSKDEWRGDDALRPLSARGRAEASALVDTLAGFGPRRIVSSPLLRCLQTVEPLAERLHLGVERCDRLLPHAGAGARELVLHLSDSPSRDVGAIVLCTHGETIDALGEIAGLDPGAPVLDGLERPQKGSVWVLELQAGKVRASRYLPPRGGSDVAASAPTRR